MYLLRLLALCSVLLLAGCSSNDIPEEIASVFVEAPPYAGGAMRLQVRLR